MSINELEAALDRQQTKGAYDTLRDILERGQGTLIKDIFDNHLGHFILRETDRHGLTVLHHAAHEGNTSLLSYLMSIVDDRRIFLREKDRQGRSVLHHAVMSDCINVVESVLKWERFCEQHDKNGLSPLHYAVRQGNKKIVDSLLKANASVTHTDKSGKAALHHVAQAKKDQAEIAKTLLSFKSRIDIFDVKGATPLHYAAESGRCDVIEVLVQHGADVNCLDMNEATPLLYAVKSNNIEAVQTLLVKGSNPDITDKSSKTAADYAVFNDGDAIKEMLTRESSKSALFCQEDGLNLIQAARQNNLSEAEALLKKGVLVNYGNWKGNTPLHFSAKAGHVKVTKHLLKSGADVNLKDKQGKSSLHYAAEGGSVDVVDLLLSKGAVTNTKDNVGKTPLNYAIQTLAPNFTGQLQRDPFQLIKMLQKEEIICDDMRDLEGKTVLHYAVQSGHPEIIQMLLKEMPRLIDWTDREGKTVLHYAVQSGNPEIIQMLLKEKPHLIDWTDREGKTVLHYAVQSGNPEIIQMLLKEKPRRIDWRDSDGKTVLHYAVQSCNPEVIQMLLKEKPHLIDWTDREGKTVLHYAVQSGNPEVIQMLLKEKPRSIDWTDREGKTVLHYAVQSGNPEIIQILLKEKPHLIDWTDREGKTVLHYAVESGNPEIIQMLLKKKPKLIHCTDWEGKTVLHHAVQSGNPDIIQVILKGKPNIIDWTDWSPGSKTVLHYAVESGNPEIIQMILKEKPEVIDWTDREGKTFLHYAVQSCNPEVIQMLLKEKPRSIDWRDMEGKTVLHYAVQSGNPEIIQILLKEKPNIIDWTDWSPEGKTVLHYAVESGNPEIIQMILKEKPELIDWTDREGKTFLHYAVQSGNPEVIQMLLKEKPRSIDRTDMEGKTVLHYAVQSGNPEIIQILLKEKPHLIDWTDREGKTVLHYAVQSGNPEVIQMLLKEKPRSIDWTDREGKTFLPYAVQSGNPEIIQMLLKEKPNLIDWRDREGKIVLHYAVESGNPEIIQMLLKKKPKLIDCTDWEGKTVLHHAVQSGNPDIIQVILKGKPNIIDWTDWSPEGKTVLHYAVESGNPEIIQMILKEKPELIDWTDMEDKTVLHYAVQSGNPEIIQMLLKEKPKLIDWTDMEDKTVLHYAVESGNPEIIQMLLKEKPKAIDWKDMEGKTFLDHAMQSGDREICQMPMKDLGTPESKVRPLRLEQHQKVLFGAFQVAKQAGYRKQTLLEKSTGSLKQEEIAYQKTIEVEANKFLELKKTSSVGSEGEVIKLVDCSLTIPPRSLCTSQDISVALKDPVQYYGYFDDVGLYSSVDIASSHVVKLRPSGVHFSCPSLLRMRLYRQPRSDEQIVVLCGSYKQDENGETKVFWEDVTSQCTTDDSLENISINIYHFCWYLVIYKSVPLQITSLLSRLNLITFKYHMAIFIKRDYPQDSYCDLRVVFMSSDIYRETKNSQQELSVLTGLKDQGYKLVSETEGAYVSKGQTLKVCLKPGTQCGFGPQEECWRDIAVDPSKWWSKGESVCFTLHCEEDSSFAGGSVEVDDGEHTKEVIFKADDWCRYLTQFFKLDEVANLLPLARELELSDEQRRWLVQDKWRSDKEQIEEILKIRARNKPNETLQELKLVVGNIEMAGEQHITTRGQMHIVNLREYKENADGLIHECSSKEENINHTAKFLLSSFLQDCCIQTMNTDDAMKGSEPKQCLVHLFENGYATREVHEKLEQCFTKSTRVDFQTISKLVPNLIQMAKRIYKKPFEMCQLSGMWGFFSEDPEIQTVLSDVKTALKTMDCTPIISNMCDLLARLCIKNEHMILVEKGNLEKWRLWSNLQEILQVAEVFMKCGESLKLKMRIEAKGSHLSAILGRKEEGKYLLRDLGSLAFCLTKFATFEASNIVRFTVTRNKESLPSPHPITYDREERMFAQTFRVVNTQEPCTVSCQADVNADGAIKTLGILRAEVVSSGDIGGMQDFLSGKRSIRVIFHENRTRMLIYGTSQKEMDEVTQSIKNRFDWTTTDVIASQELKLVMASDKPCGSKLCLTLLYRYGDQGISHQGDKLSIVYEDVPAVEADERHVLLTRGSKSCSTKFQIDNSEAPSAETLMLQDAVSAGELNESTSPIRPRDELLADNTNSNTEMVHAATSVLEHMKKKKISAPVVFQFVKHESKTTVNNQQTYKNDCYGPTAIGDQSSISTTESPHDKTGSN